MRTYAEADAGAVHALLQEAFAGSAEEVPPFARWHPWMTQDPGFDAGVWFLAEAGGELARGVSVLERGLGQGSGGAAGLARPRPR